MYVDKNIMGHIYENGKENLVLRFIQKHFIKINLNKNTFNENVAIYMSNKDFLSSIRTVSYTHLTLPTT